MARGRVAGPLVLGALAAAAHAQPASFTPLGHIPNGYPGGHSYANSLSADGSTVVGYGYDTSLNSRAFRWRADTGYQDLGDLGGGSADAYDVNQDGSVVVGYSYAPGFQHLGFRWTPAAGMQAMPMYEVMDVSGDGDLMVGMNTWRRASGQTGMFDPAGGFTATGIATLGHVVVGYKYVGGFAHAFRWTFAEGPVDLGVTTGTESDARGVSGDGAVIVGEARDNSIQQFWRAFRWTAAGGMQDLGTLGGPMSNAFDASFDGSVIVGTSLINSGSGSQRAFIWTAQGGMRDLRQILIDAGATGLGNWILQAANGVSSDGRTIAGFGIPGTFQPSQPFIAVLPAPAPPPCYANCDASTAPPILNVADFSCFLTRYAAGDPYANCDASTAPPALNVQDFSCFLTRYAAGCP